MNKSSKAEITAILAALSFSTASGAGAATVNLADNSQSGGGQSLFGVTEHQSPTRLGAEDGCGEGACGSADQSKGEEGSCKSKDESSKNKDGSSKDKKGAVKKKESEKTKLIEL
ncbi:MAG: hypothetical protein K8F91_04550 [Candidatus Obscuribacterales bacterium]|nr:hypothetical protein [Candidatus Obscuribacterales bacterium]